MHSQNFCEGLWLKWATLTFHPAYSNLNFIFSILTVMMMEYRFLANKHLILEAEPCDFLRASLRLPQPKIFLCFSG